MAVKIKIYTGVINMNMNFKCKLPIPKEVKEQYPVTAELQKIIDERNSHIADIIKGQDDRLIRQLLQALLRPEKIPDGNSGITLLLQIIQLLLEILHRHIVLVSILGLLRLHHVVLKDRKALRLRLRQQVLQSAIASQQHRCQGSQPPFQIFFHAITSFA